MTDEQIAMNIEIARKSAIATAMSLAKLGLPLEHIAAGTASAAAQIMGGLVPAADVDKAIEAMMPPMKADARAARAITPERRRPN